MAINYGNTANPVAGTLGGNQVGQQTNYGAPGVASPGTPSTQPGWTYGAGPTNTQIQGSVAPGQTDTSRINAAQMPNMQVQTGQQYYQPAQDAYYKQATSRLDPQWQSQQAQMETQLENMGHTRGSAAWNSEMQRFGQQRNDAYNTAQNQAIMNSGQEAQRMQGMDIAAGNFGNQATQQNYLNQRSSQQDQNAAYQQAFQQAMDSGKFANAAQAQEFAQNQVNAQIRNAAMTQQGTFAEQQAARAQQESQFGRSQSQQESQYGRTLEEQQAARGQQGQQFGQTLAETRAGREQQGQQFGQTLQEQQAARGQQAAQFAQSYDLQTRAQQAQMDQFAQTLGMTGKQLDAQIGQWAEQNGISREQMATQLLMSREQGQTSRDVANIGAQASANSSAAAADASRYSTDAYRTSAQASQDLATRRWQQEIERQAQFDPYLLQNVAMGGMSPTGGTLGGSVLK